MVNKKLALILVICSVMMNNVTFASFAYATIIFLPILAIIFIYRSLRLDALFVYIILLTLFVLIGQAIVFNTFSLYNFGGPFLIFLTPFFVYRLVGLDFFRLYVKIIYVLAIISLVLWSLQNVFDGFTQILISISKNLRMDPESNESILIYNLELGRSSLGFIKNAGFVAEGGLYSTFLIVALYLNNFFTNRFFGTKNLIFIISIVTTSSTAGYTALLFYFLFAAFSIRSKLAMLLALPLAVLFIFNTITELPFMFEKVNKSFTDEMNVYNSQINPARRGRFLSARVDLDLIKKYPLTGIGLYTSVRYRNDEERNIGYSNSYMGIIGLASRYGLIVWSFYLFFLIKFFYSLKRLSNNTSNRTNRLFPLFFCLSILSVAMGQNPFYSFVYIIMLYAGYDLTRRRNKFKTIGTT
jgi:hypothetical protein